MKSRVYNTVPMNQSLPTIGGTAIESPLYDNHSYDVASRERVAFGIFLVAIIVLVFASRPKRAESNSKPRPNTFRSSPGEA